MNTPDNTNPAILRGMLNSLAGSSGDNGNLVTLLTVVDLEGNYSDVDKTGTEIKALTEAGTLVVLIVDGIPAFPWTMNNAGDVRFLQMVYASEQEPYYTVDKDGKVTKHGGLT